MHAPPPARATFQARTLLPPLIACLPGFLLAALSPASLAQPFRIEAFERDPAGVPRIRFESDPASYFVLVRGGSLGALDHPVAVAPGVTGSGELIDPTPIRERAFYQVLRFPKDRPSDLDRDGMDDVYELGHAPALHPLRSDDALEDADGDERPNLLEFEAGSDPLQPDLFVLTSPGHRESGISVNRETEFRFTVPLAPDTTLDGSRFWAEARGRKLLTRTELSTDRRTATLFYLEPLPGLTQIRVFLDGAGIRDASGRALDLDANGQPGGIAAIEYTTGGVTPVAGTAVIGRVYASEPVASTQAPGAPTRPPLAGVTITVDGAEESLRTVTDAEGRFTLTPCPPGRFFVHVDGRTVADSATGIRWPDQSYYPFVGKTWEAVAGVMTNLAGGTGEIYLPLIARDALQNVSPVVETRIGFAPSVVAAYPSLAGAEITVPPNALFADDGTRGGRVGLAPVDPDRLPEPLPPGLSFPVVITVQTDGPLNFDQPVPVKFPNLPDPTTGRRLAPGEKSALWSFDHDRGSWEMAGPMTVSPDGLLVVSDPGVGIRQPGWHGSSPGTSGDGPPPGPSKPPKPPRPPRPPLSPPTPPPPPPPPAPTPTPTPDPGGAGDGDDGDSPIPDFPDLPDIPFIDEPESWGDLVSMLVDQLPTMGPDVFGPIVDIGKEAIDLASDFNEVLENHGPVDADGNGVPDVMESQQEFLEQIGESAGDLFPSAPEDADDASDTLAGWWEIWYELYGGAGPALHASSPRASLHGGEQPPAAALPHLAELQRESVDLQRLAGLQAAFDGYFLAVVGSNDWQTLATSGIQVQEVLPLLQAMSAAQQAGTEGGASITASEATAIVALPAPRIRREIITNLVARLNLTLIEYQRGRVRRQEGAPGSPDIIDAAEARDALQRLAAEMNLEADAGYTHPAARGQALAARMGPALGGFFGAYLPSRDPEPAAENDYPVLLEIFPPGGGVVEQHLRTDSRGQLGSLRLPANAIVIVRWLDPETLRVASSFLTTGPAGTRFTIPQAVWNENTPTADADSDGLPDVAERILGTLVAVPNSDGDGVPDGAEVRARTNPLDGIIVQPGIVANTDTPGQAVDIAVETYDLSAFGGAPSVTRLLVADGPAGIAVLESNGGRPVLLGQLDTPGDARRVALPPAGTLLPDELGLGAYADGPQGVGIVDLTDPLRPRTRATVTPEGSTLSVTIHGGVVYAGTDRGRLLAVDIYSGEVIDELNLGYPVQDLKVHQQTLFTAGIRLSQASLQAVQILESGVFGTPGTVVSSVAAQTRRGIRLAVGDGFAYTLHGRGYSTWNITNLFAPSLVAPGVGPQFGWFQIAPNGSGLGVACVGPNASDDGPHDVSVYDLRDPARTDQFLRTLVTPGIAASVATHEGLAYVADTEAGVQVLQYQAADRGTQAPAVTLRTGTGPQVTAGSRIAITATAIDDVAVRLAELWVNGVATATDHTWPYEFAFRAPVAGPTAGQAAIITNLVVQVRAVDTVGNEAWSTSQTLQVVPDTTAPRVVRFEPGDDRTVPADSALVVSFDEAMDPNSLSPATLIVQSAGPDAVLGTADDRTMEGWTLSFLERANRVVLNHAGELPSGDYRIVVAGTVRDASGNAMGNPATSDFRVRGGDLRQGGSFGGDGAFPEVGLRDLYAFLGRAGQRVYVDLESGGGVGMRWTLRAPDGRIVFTEAAFFDVGTVELPLDGRYELTLERIGAMQPGYRFSIWDIPAPDVFPIALEQTITEGSPGPGAGRIETPGVHDAYTFNATAGEVIYVDLQGGESAATRWRLLDESGGTVFDEGLFFDPGVVTLARGGRYTLTVGNPRSDHRGTYAFRLWKVPAPQTFSIGIGDTVANNTPAPGAGNLETPGVQDLYTFTAPPGQRVFVDLLEGGSSALRWRLLDETGTAVFDEGFFFDPGVITLDRGGRYTLTIGNTRNDYTGTYRFRILEVPATQTFPIAIGDTVRDGSPGPGAGNLESPGAQDLYTFQATPGQTVFVDLQQGGVSALRWRLTDETGAAVFDEGFFFDPGIITLDRGGRYTLTIGNTRNDYTGTYQFRLWPAPAPQTFPIAIGDTVRDGVPGPGAGNIETPGVLDVYTFDATPGQRVYFDLIGGGRSSWTWRLVDESGAQVFNEGFFFDPGEKTLNRGGRYTLTVGNPRADTTGTYEFQLRTVP